MKMIMCGLTLAAVLGCSGKKDEPAKLGPECKKTLACCAELVAKAPEVESLCDKAKATQVEASCTSRRREAIELAQVKDVPIPPTCR